MTEEDRCTGHCCQGFSGLGHYSELKAAYEEALAKDPNELRLRDEEMLEIFPMLIPLRLPMKDEFSLNPLHAIAEIRRPLTPEELAEWSDPNRHPMEYSCKNQLPNGDCGIYETRPHMCSSYPNGHRCLYVMCGSKTLKNIGAKSHVGSRGEPFVPVENLVRFKAIKLESILLSEGEVHDVRSEDRRGDLVQAALLEEEADVRHVG